MKRMIIIIAGLILFLNGCGLDQAPITAESEGIWNHYFVYPLSWALLFIAQLANGSYGFAIIIMTIVIRLLLLPLFIKQQKSSQAMRKIQPKLKKLQDKYDMKKQTDQQKFQQEMLQLYRDQGVNPLAGCLPIFIQLPILMAFYFAIIRTEEIATHPFLWMNLGEPDPFYLLPIAAGVAMFFQTRLTSTEIPVEMKPALYIMPLMVIGFGAFLPAALSLYWFTGSVFMIVQTYVFYKKNEA